MKKVLFTIAIKVIKSLGVNPSKNEPDFRGKVWFIHYNPYLIPIVGSNPTITI